MVTVFGSSCSLPMLQTKRLELLAIVIPTKSNGLEFCTNAATRVFMLVVPGQKSTKSFRSWAEESAGWASLALVTLSVLGIDFASLCRPIRPIRVPSDFLPALFWDGSVPANCLRLYASKVVSPSSVALHHFTAQ